MMIADCRIALDPRTGQKLPSSTAKYQASVVTVDRNGRATSPDSATVYLRVIDSEAVVVPVLTDTAGLALSNSALSNFPYDQGWKQLGTVQAVGSFEIAIASDRPVARCRLQVGYRTEGVIQSRESQFSIVEPGASTWDVTGLDAKIGDTGGESLVTRVAAVADDIDVLLTRLGVPSSTIKELIESVAAQIGSPAGGDVASMGAAIKTVVDGLAVSVGSVGESNLSAMLTAARGVIDLIKTATDDLTSTLAAVGTTLGSPAGGSVSAALAALSTTLGYTDASISDDLQSARVTLLDQIGAARRAQTLIYGFTDDSFAHTNTVIQCTGLGPISRVGHTVVIHSGAGTGTSEARTITAHDTALNRITVSPALSFTPSGEEPLFILVGDPVVKGMIGDTSGVTLVSRLATLGDRIGTPSGSVTDDIAALSGDIAGVASTLGTPAVSVASDLQRIGESSFVDMGTLDGGFTHTATVVQASSLHGTIDFYTGQVLHLRHTAALKQESRLITSYNAGSKQITVDPAFSFVPVNGDIFAVRPHDPVVSARLDAIETTLAAIKAKTDTIP